MNISKNKHTKKTKINFKVFVIVAFLLVSNILIATLLFYKNINPDFSSAIFGGKEEDSAYPYAGYAVSYISPTTIDNCGTVFINPSIALSAAHCFPTKSQTYLGLGEYNSSKNFNYPVSDITILPKWDGKDNSKDLAVIKLLNPISNANSFVRIVAPQIGCNYEILGYGKTEDNEKLKSGEKLRKSAVLCIEKITDELIYLRGEDGGICLGDSGSPIFEKGTNNLVGINSAITTDKDPLQNDPCFIGNKSIAVRIDNNLDFINSYIVNTFQSDDVAVCGNLCSDKKCSPGLECVNSICQLPDNQGCLALESEYCSTYFNIGCQNNLSCLTNTCTKNEVLELAEQKNENTVLSIEEISESNEIPTIDNNLEIEPSTAIQSSNSDLPKLEVFSSNTKSGISLLPTILAMLSFDTFFVMALYFVSKKNHI